MNSNFQSLEEKDRRNAGHKETLHRHNRYLRRRLESLGQVHVAANNASAAASAAVAAALSKRRSVSESSSTTFYSLSTNSSASPSRSESGKSCESKPSILFVLLLSGDGLKNCKIAIDKSWRIVFIP